MAAIREYVKVAEKIDFDVNCYSALFYQRDFHTI